MRVGLTMFATDVSIDIVELGVEAEARGFSSLWLPEHSHIPVQAGSMPDGTPLPDEYRRVVDAPVALAACAMATKTIRLGSGISIVAQHDPIGYAKTWATLDRVSNGRALFGVGFGWNVEEMGDHGVAYTTRRERTREHVLAMQRLWVEEQAMFRGDFVEFGPSWSWPKPLQQPRIPTYIGGGAGPKMFAHIAEYADGWLPMGGSGLREALPALREAWASAGRADRPQVVPFGTVPSGEKLAYYELLGCPEVVFRVPSVPRDPALRVLDGFTAFV